MKSGKIAAAAAAVGVLAAAGQAHAASLAVNAPCFIEGTPITATAAGFTPGGSVNFTFDGQLADSALADGAGNITEPLVAPVLGTNQLQHTFNLAAQDTTNPAVAATTPVPVTKFAASFSPKRARPRRKVKFRVQGFPPGRTVYLHYVFHRKARARVKLGRPKAPCGGLSKRKRFFPMRHPKVGTWTFRFDTRKRYSTASRPFFSLKVLIFRTFR